MTVAVAASNLGYEVDGRKLLSSVSLEVATGQLCAIVGPSGAGKSTLLKLLCLLRRPTHGRVQLLGLDAATARQRSDLIGYVPQDDIVHNALTVGAVLEYAAELRLWQRSASERQQRVDQVLEMLELRARRDVRVRRLSGGQRKRVSIGVELITEPPLLFLDEPTSGLDPGLEQQLMRTMRELASGNRAVLLTTHVMESMDTVDLLAVIYDGHLAYWGPPRLALEFFRVGELRALFDQLKKQPAAAWLQALERARPTLLAAVRPPTVVGTPLPGAVGAGAAAAATSSDLEAQFEALKRKARGDGGGV